MNEENARRTCSDCAATGPQSFLSAYGATEEGIGRRTFLVQSGILAAAAALAACGTTAATAPNVPTGSSINVNNYPTLANPGGVAMVSFGGAPVAIVRTSTSSFLALSRVCPHQGNIVQLSNNGFVCPGHGALFDIDGRWIGGQRTSSLHQYPTSYDASTNTLTVG